MSRRPPSTSRFVHRVRRTVRASLETVKSLVRVGHRSEAADSGFRIGDDPHRTQRDQHDRVDRYDRTDEQGRTDRYDRTDQLGRSDRDRGTGTRLESRPDPNSRPVESRPNPSSRPGSKADLLDPDNGPTSCSEILEHGCLPAQYVRAVLAEHGGRLKQRRFVDEYGWSPSTVSELLSTLEDDGAIERYRIGREKVIRLPDEERRPAPMAGGSRENSGR